MNICQVKECVSSPPPSKPRQKYCGKHYARWKRHGDPLLTLTTPGGRKASCTATKCKAAATARLKTNSPLCPKHYHRLRRYGVFEDHDYEALRPKRRRDQSKTVYTWIKHNGKWKFEHRAVMEDFLGRPLAKGETVHHKNGKTKDNRIGNLELWASTHPSGQRVTDLVAWAREIETKYGHLCSR